VKPEYCVDCGCPLDVCCGYKRFKEIEKQKEIFELMKSSLLKTIKEQRKALKEAKK